MKNKKGSLEGIRVIDFGQWLAGPLTAMLLADFGADVIRVDPPGGPRWNHPANAILQRNKRSTALNLKSADDVVFARRLISTADVVIENFRPGVMSRLGLDPAETCASNPRLVWCSIPGFGCDDPRSGLAAYEGMVCAAASLYPPRLGACEGGPRFSAIPYASTFGAFIAAHSVMAALIARERYNHGDRIEVPLFGAALEAIAVNLENPSSDSRDRVHSLLRTAGISNPANHKLYKCRDGRFLRRDIPLRGLHKFWDHYMPAGLKDDTSSEGAGWAEHLLEELFRTKDAREWEALGQRKFRAAFASQQTVTEWLHDDHAAESRSIIGVVDPILGETRQAGFGVRVSASEQIIRSGRHLPGLDNAAVRREVDVLLAASKPGVGSVEKVMAGSAKPLAGIRVLDLATLIAGPGSSRILAEYGAEVIKISKTGLANGKINPTSDEPLMFYGHRTTGAGKKSMFVDLRSEHGRQIAQALAANADVVCVNFAPGVAEEMGVGESQLREIQPNIVYSTVNVHGKGGWRESFRGHEQVGQAVSGMMMRFGGNETPEELPILLNDYGTAHLSALGMLIALFDGFRGGGGCAVEAALSRTATLFQIPFMIDYVGRSVNEPGGAGAMGWTPYDRLYQCANGWLYLAAIDDSAISRLRSIECLGGVWNGSEDQIEASLERAFLAAPKERWLALLQQAEVPAHAYLDITSHQQRETLVNRRMVVEKDHPGMGLGEVIGIAARVASEPGRIVAAASQLGYHTFEVLEDLGFDSDQIEEFVRSEVVAGPMASESA